MEAKHLMNQLLLIEDYGEKTCITWSINYYGGVLSVRSTLQGVKLKTAINLKKSSNLNDMTTKKSKQFRNCICQTNCKIANKLIGGGDEKAVSILVMFTAQ